MVSFADLAKTRKIASDEEGWEVYDSLSPVSVDELIGWRWKGYEIENGHPSNGSLEASNWFGKEFFDEDNVHPLLTYNALTVEERTGDDVWPCFPPSLFQFLAEGKEVSGKTRDQLEAKTTSARLKTILYRGVDTASMFYDNVPINDTFKKVDENTVLGVMDFKGEPKPFFFVLEKYKPLKDFYSDYEEKYGNKN